MATRPDANSFAESAGLSWRLHANGSFMLCDADRRLHVPRGRKARAIIGYLARHLNEHVSRNRLTELLWPERAASQARGSLRQSLLEIRRTAPQLIDSDPQHVWIEEDRLQICSDCHAAEDDVLYADLDGITPEFDDWLRCERAERSVEEWAALVSEAEALLGEGLPARALRLIERMHRIDPYNEDWLRLAMRAEYQAAHPAGIQTRFQTMAHVLKRELGVNISSQTRRLRDDLLSALAPAEEPSLIAGDFGKKRRGRFN